MSRYSFFATIHPERFYDLNLLVGDNIVAIEPYSFGDDGTYLVHIKGESSFTRKLDRAVNQIKHILSSAPVFKEAL